MKKQLLVNGIVFVGSILFLYCIFQTEAKDMEVSASQESLHQIEAKATIYFDNQQLELKKMASQEAVNYSIETENLQKAVVETTVSDELVPVYSRQSIKSITMDEFELLAKCVMAESGGESFEGQYMVAEVVLNRVEDEDYPDTISEVIKQKTQFTTWSNGMIEEAVPTDSVYEAVQLALEVRDIPTDIIFFSSEGYQTAYGIPWKQVGNHYFSKKK